MYTIILLSIDTLQVTVALETGETHHWGLLHSQVEEDPADKDTLSEEILPEGKDPEDKVLEGKVLEGMDPVGPEGRAFADRVLVQIQAFPGQSWAAQKHQAAGTGALLGSVSSWEGALQIQQGWAGQRQSYEGDCPPLQWGNHSCSGTWFYRMITSPYAVERQDQLISTKADTATSIL